MCPTLKLGHDLRDGRVNGYIMKRGKIVMLCDICYNGQQKYKIVINAEAVESWEDAKDDPRLIPVWLSSRYPDYVLICLKCAAKLGITSHRKITCPSWRVVKKKHLTTDPASKVLKLKIVEERIHRCTTMDLIGLKYSLQPPCTQCIRSRLRRAIGIKDDTYWDEWYKERHLTELDGYGRLKNPDDEYLKRMRNLVLGFSE